MTNSYATCVRIPNGYRGQIFLNGEGRWVREAKTTEELAKRLLAIIPDLNNVLTETGIQDADCLTFAECLEAISF